MAELRQGKEEEEGAASRPAEGDPVGKLLGEQEEGLPGYARYLTSDAIRAATGLGFLVSCVVVYQDTALAIEDHDQSGWQTRQYDS